MKKIIFAFLIPLGFLIGMDWADAATKLDTNQQSDGNININMTFEEGYVGGIHITMQVNGNVELESIEWNPNLSEKYTKKYFYNNNILTILITAGDSSKNLLDINKNLNFGILHFKNNTNDLQNYSLTPKEVTIVDANYKSVTIKITGSETGFQLAGKKEEPSIPINPENPTEPTIPNNPSNNQTPSDTKVENSSEEENKEEKSSDTKDDKKEETTKTEDKNENITDSKNDKKDEEQKKDTKKSPNYLLVGLGIVGILVFVLWTLYYMKKLNQKEA